MLEFDSNKLDMGNICTYLLNLRDILKVRLIIYLVPYLIILKNKFEDISFLFREHLYFSNFSTKSTLCQHQEANSKSDTNKLFAIVCIRFNAK